MIRKYHLQHTVSRGPTCQTGRQGGSLRGEHITFSAEEFVSVPAEKRCDRCANSKLFAFLQRRAAQVAVSA